MQNYKDSSGNTLRPFIRSTDAGLEIGFRNDRYGTENFSAGFFRGVAEAEIYIKRAVEVHGLQPIPFLPADGEPCPVCGRPAPSNELCPDCAQRKAENAEERERLGGPEL